MIPSGRSYFSFPSHSKKLFKFKRIETEDLWNLHFSDIFALPLARYLVNNSFAVKGPVTHFRCSAFVLAAVGLALSLVTGCGVHNPPLQVGTELSGNWAFAPSNSSGNNSALVLNLGFTQGAYETASAIARLNGASCIGSTTNIFLSGSVSANGEMMLVSTPFNGTTLTLRGQVAEDGGGIAGATWSFTGGSCASIGSMNVAATNYTEIAGTYTGTFEDTDGNKLPVSAFLQQTTQPDSNGQFSLSGTAEFPSNTCFVQQPTMTQSLVTGSSLSMTYTDPAGSAVLTASGSFNSTATQLTITKWSITGGYCNGDSGAGLLTSANAVQ